MEKKSLLSLALEYHKEENLDPGDDNNIVRDLLAQNAPSKPAEHLTIPEKEIKAEVEEEELIEEEIEEELQLESTPDIIFDGDTTIISGTGTESFEDVVTPEESSECLSEPSTSEIAEDTPLNSSSSGIPNYSGIGSESIHLTKMGKSKRILKVKVLNARNLINKETFTKSDPLCMIELGKTSKKTKSISNNLNPDFNEEFTFHVDTDSEVLAVSLWDHNTFRKDVFMGSTFVEFRACKMGVGTTKCAKIIGESGGEVNLVLTPMFETSVTTIEKLSNELKSAGSTNANYQSDNEALQAELGKMSAENDRFSENNKKLEEENNKFEENNNRLEASVNKLEGENQKFEENNKKLEQENKRFEENNNRLEETVSKLEGENKKFEENNLKLEAEVNRLGGEIDKMAEENNKFAANNAKLEEEVGKLEGEVTKMGELNKEFEANNEKLKATIEKLEGELQKMNEENNKFAANNLALEEQVGKLTGEVDKISAENTKFEENNKKMEAELAKMMEENERFAQNNRDLSAEIAKLKEQIDVMAGENAKFAENNENLKKQVDALSAENEKFAENNRVLEEQNNNFQKNNEELSKTIESLNEQAAKFNEVREKLSQENEKLSAIRDGLQNQLEGFKKLQQLIFNKLNEKMRAMDRSLLEKIGADIEMMDKEEGLSRAEFGKFMKRVPTHLRQKFEKIADDFQRFDVNKDNVIDSDEFGSMLDQVMKET